MNILKFIYSEKKYLLFIFLTALFIRLIYVIPLSPEKLSPDSYGWMSIASGIASGNGYGDTWRPPGYPAFLAIIFFIFGKSILFVRVINSIISALTCVIIYFVGKKIFSPVVGKISAVLLCFYPYVIAYTGDLLSETFYTFLTALSIYYILICSEKPSIKNIIFTGILFGITALTKSTILPFFFFACAWLWWRTKKIKVGFFVGICTIITLAPWTFRNYFYYSKNYIMPINTPWYSFYGATCDEALWMETYGELDTPAPDAIVTPAIPKDWEYISTLPLPERDKICKEKSFNWIKNNSHKYTYLLYKRFIHFWRLYPMMAYKWQKYMAMVTSGIYIPFAFAGIVLSIKNIGKTSLLIALLSIYTFVHLFFTVVLRYRIPVDPYVMIFASYTIVEILLKLKILQCE
ncbi:MAG: glycosyltransferase family 39 protein [Elusimicrobia bacterium]|nr:glycosyltransferase family 39 protein [Elusimicrobiota bacterium]